MGFRRRGFRQKPWNKVSRIEKFWTTNPQLYNAVTFGLTTNNAIVCVDLTGSGLAADQSHTTFPRALSHVKVHRMQGHIYCWLDKADRKDFVAAAFGGVASPAYPEAAAVTPTTGIEPRPNMAMLNYIWLKVKSDANTPSDPNYMGTAGDFNPNVTHDWTNLAQRDDVMLMGTTPIFGVVDMMMTTQAATTNGGYQIGLPGQYIQGRVAQIPLPRLPKLGLNLKMGEHLLLCVACWPGPGDWSTDSIDDTTPLRPVTIYPQLRLLCSI